MSDGSDSQHYEKLRERLGNEEFHNLYRYDWRRRPVRRGPVGEFFQRLIPWRAGIVLLAVIALLAVGRYAVRFATTPAPVTGTVAVTTISGDERVFSGLFRSADGTTTEAVVDAHATGPVRVGDSVRVWYLGAGRATTVDPGGGGELDGLGVVLIALAVVAVGGVTALLIWLRRAASPSPE